MLCDELKTFDVGLGQYSEDGSPCVVAFDAGRNPRLLNEKVYLKSEVDSAIAELKAENERLKRCEIWMKQHFFCEEVIDCESAKNRKLKRALWLARATIAHNAIYKYQRLACKAEMDPQPHGWSCYINGEVYRTGKMNRMLEPHYWTEIWENVECKCLKKAEEYK